MHNPCTVSPSEYRRDMQLCLTVGCLARYVCRTSRVFANKTAQASLIHSRRGRRSTFTIRNPTFQKVVAPQPRLEPGSGVTRVSFLRRAIVSLHLRLLMLVLKKSPSKYSKAASDIFNVFRSLRLRFFAETLKV